MPFPLAVVVVVLTAAVGAFTQRVSGLGFSLIAAPSLALAVGAREGVTLTNMLSLLVALGVFATSARHLDAGKSAVLIPAGLIGVVPGIIVFQLLPASLLQVTVGVVTGLGLVTVAAVGRLRVAPRLAITVAAGLASGFTTAVAGAGGPALTVYAVATDWPQPLFAATGQINYAVQAAAALGIKGIPSLHVIWLSAAIAAVMAGLAAGHLLAHRINVTRARRAAIAIAALATALTVIHGCVSLVRG